jgi:Na+/proline symporter
MSPILILSLILCYFTVLLVISWFTGKKATNETFFLANKSAPWYLVAFGMVGASLSGITFISVPGKVGNPIDQMSYLQMVLGFMLGYVFIAYVLMPIYYKLQVTSIYTYLQRRFGQGAYKTGAFYFLLSRSFGASIRLLLVAVVLQEILFSKWGVPFWMTVIFSILLIWVYTFRGGIKTIIFTDTLQTAFMLTSLGLSIWLISTKLDFGEVGLISTITESSYSKVWFFDNFATNKFHFWKEFIGGFFICITMTGMDQDMMQKNLACPNIKDAQKNMISFAVVLGIVNVLFMALGALLFIYKGAVDFELPLSVAGSPRTDLLFPLVALDQSTFGIGLGIFFLLGLIAAAYSSADSALTSLTTSLCIDFLDIENKPEDQKMPLRKRVHIIMSAVLFVIVIFLHAVLDMNAISMVIFLAGLTYGPLLGIFLLGIFTKLTPPNWAFPVVALASPVLSYLINIWAATPEVGFVFGSLLIALNGLITFIGLGLIALWVRRRKGLLATQ